MLDRENSHEPKAAFLYGFVLNCSERLRFGSAKANADGVSIALQQSQPLGRLRSYGISSDFRSNVLLRDTVSYPVSFFSAGENHLIAVFRSGQQPNSDTVVEYNNWIEICDTNTLEVKQRIEGLPFKRGHLFFDKDYQQLLIANCTSEYGVAEENDRYEFRTLTVSNHLLSAPIRFPARREILSFHRTDKSGFWFICRSIDGKCEIARLNDETHSLDIQAAIPGNFPASTIIEPGSDGKTAILLEPAKNTLSYLDLSTGDTWPIDTDVSMKAALPPTRSEYDHLEHEFGADAYLRSNGRLVVPLRSATTNSTAFLTRTGRLLISPSGRYVAFDTGAAWTFRDRIREVRVYDLLERKRLCSLAYFHEYASPVAFIGDAEDRLVVCEARYSVDLLELGPKIQNESASRSSPVSLVTIWDLNIAAAEQK